MKDYDACRAADNEEYDTHTPIDEAPVAKLGGEESQETYWQLDKSIADHAAGEDKLILPLGIADDEDEIEEGRSKDSETGTHKSTLMKEGHDEKNDGHIVDNLKKHIRLGVALGERDILDGQFQHTEIHCEDDHLHHADGRKKASAVEGGAERATPP